MRSEVDDLWSPHSLLGSFLSLKAFYFCCYSKYFKSNMLSVPQTICALMGGLKGGPEWVVGMTLPVGAML